MESAISSSFLLIEPYGIEIALEVGDLKQYLSLLIEPYGIEIPLEVGDLKQYLSF